MTRPACAVLGNPRQVVYQLVAKANIAPLKSTESQSGVPRTASAGLVLYGVLDALYNQSNWVGLGQALIAAQKGDARDLLEFADSYSGRDGSGNYSNLLDAFTAFSCNDTPVGPTDAVIHATATAWATQYPMFGLWGASSLFACQDWQPTRHPLPAVTATGSTPILVVGSTHDPATPYSGAQHLATALTTGVLLTWQGQGHTAYLKSTCITDQVDAYLVDQTVPVVGSTCPA
jgi:hypothetical protein